MNRQLSTGGRSPSAKPKKREWEKRSAPLTPLREKGKGKEEQDRVSCETCFSKTARAREAKASVRVFFFRGGRGGGGDRRQLLSAEREGLRSLGVVLPPLRQEPHRREGVLLRFVQTAGRGSGRRYRVPVLASQGVREVRDGVTAFQFWLGDEFGEKGGAR